jgi:carboxyl-terminal processing protease
MRKFLIFFLLILILSINNIINISILFSDSLKKKNISFNQSLINKNFDDKSLKKILDFLVIFKQNTTSNISDEEIAEKMINGFLKEVDQYGNFFTNKNEYKNFSDHLQDNYNGIGVNLNKEKNNNFFYIQKIQKDSFAYKAGLKIGDIINSIDNIKPNTIGPIECELDKNLSLSVTRYENIENFFENNQINWNELSNHYSSQKNFNILVSCQNIKQENLEFKMIDNEIGLLRIYSFANNISKDVEKILKDGNYISSMNGLIIDLRNNGGGIRDEALFLASMFLEKKSLLFSIKDNHNKISAKFDSKPELFLKNSSHINIIILVNRNSASASEIFTASLRDNKRAIIAGEKTFGKGVSQSIFELDNGKFLKITTSSIITPNGFEIQNNGLMPDIDLSNDSKFFESLDFQKFYYDNKNSIDSNKDFNNDLQVYILYKILKTKNSFNFK